MAWCKVLSQRRCHSISRAAIPPCMIRYSPPRRSLASPQRLNHLLANAGRFFTTRTQDRAKAKSIPRRLPTKGFDLFDADQLLEEQSLPEYRSEDFYPVRLGEVFNDKFQVVSKLGYGSSSTIWFARDLEDHQYVALKIYIHNSSQHRELPFYERFTTALPSKHPGVENIRKFVDAFEIVGTHGKHIVLVLQVSQMSIRDMDTVFMKGNGFDEEFVKGAIKQVLQAVDFMHTELRAVHTDIHSGNLLLGLNDNSHFGQLEAAELSNPMPRKILQDRTIYSSRLMKPKGGPLLLSDFGEARLGPGPHAGDIMPVMYRAPETLLWIQWSYPVDIWSVGLTAWDLLEGRTLFSARKEDGSLSDGAHFSEMIAALDPPPLDLLNRHRERASTYWDGNGNWTDFVPITSGKSLETVETKLKDKSKFLSFIRRALAWDPKQRPTARELLDDPWLAGVD